MLPPSIVAPSAAAFAVLIFLGAAWSGLALAQDATSGPVVAPDDDAPPRRPGSFFPTGVFDPLYYVNPLIGASNGGNVFAGASLPYGMAKAVADTNASSNQGGFAMDYGAFVTGFSAMHDSGTGGQPSLGNFPLFPHTNCGGGGSGGSGGSGGGSGDVNGCVYPKKARAALGAFANDTVFAAPGYFSITLLSGVRVDMTTSARAALFRFKFPERALDGSPAQPLILQDLADLSDSRQDNATVNVNATTGRMTGSARFKPSFGSGDYVLHFCTDFNASSNANATNVTDILDSGIFVNSRANTSVKTLTISRSINNYPLPGGGFVRFKSGALPILARVATSFISPEQACSNAEREIPHFEFNVTQDAAAAAWREKLRPIRVSSGEGMDLSLLTNFYSGVYRTMINPQNYTGENPLWTSLSGEPYFDSFYCLWDSFRSQIPFLTVIDPTAVTHMIRSLIDTYRHVGWLPDCRMSLCKGFTQGGSNADNVLADAFLKGITDGVNWVDGYQAMVRDAEVEPYDWSNQGRGGLDSWHNLGYIPVQDFDYKGFGTMTRSVSRTLEYSYNDFCISQVGSRMNFTDSDPRRSDSSKYIARSGNWANLFRRDQTSFLFDGTDTGFGGFFQPRFLNGTWAFQNPLNCSNIEAPGASICSLQNTAGETFESSLWEYGFFVPHAQADLITLYGGPKEFVRRLDYLHDSNITYIGNEPSFLTVFQYHYAGRPGLSAKRAHYYIPASFSPKPDGLPGNDDSGAMGSFVAFAMMGLFPNPGQDVYFITPPFFPQVNITHPLTNRTARIKSNGWDAEYRNIYVQNATLDGKPYTRNWIDHSFFTAGKELVLELGPIESATWGTRVEDLPPSLGKYVGFESGSGVGGSASASASASGNRTARVVVGRGGGGRGRGRGRAGGSVLDRVARAAREGIEGLEARVMRPGRRGNDDSDYEAEFGPVHSSSG